MSPLKIIITSLLFVITCCQVSAGGNLSDNIRIKSTILGYDLQYRVYTPENAEENLPTLYITDGQWYLQKGNMDKILDQQIKAGVIKPVIAIFIDNRNPDKLRENRRNKQFFCSSKYANFFLQELVPQIDHHYHTSSHRKDRVILGVSFGGLNSACFGLMAYSAFQGIAMQSAASDKHVRLINKLYASEDKKPIKIYMSVGTRNDNMSANRLLKRTLQKKGYDLSYKEVPKSHNWKNWRPLLKDVLINFFAVEKNTAQ
ncbi:MAG: esterase family protein [Alphaproteobacteria bacterium]|nr:esterase family protein [Alphaproteobacteria bacterium]